MNPPSRLVSLALLCTASLAAQAMQFSSAVVPGTFETRIDGARPGAIVLVPVGLQSGAFAVLGGPVLGLEPQAIAGVAIADAQGFAFVRAGFPVGAGAGLGFYAQAVALDPAAPPFAALDVSAVSRLDVPRHGALADVYVLFGQSNAEGQGQVAQLPPSLLGPIPRCRVWSHVAGEFQPLTAGVNNRTFSPPIWCGPEMSLARALTADGRVVYLVKFAVAQTALGATPGPWNEWGVEAGELYALLQASIANACRALRADGLEPRVRGICMMQGESDATAPQWAEGYQALLDALVRRCRGDLLAGELTDGRPVPFVIGLIDEELPASWFPFVGAVRAAQQAVAAALPRCATVDATGLAVNHDRVHFSAAGVVALGQRFAAALRTFE